MKIAPVIWFALAVVLMGLGHVLCPVAIWINGPWRWLGLLPIAVGLVLPLYHALVFVRAGTSFKPFTEPDRLVTSHMYRFSRNPMYLGLGLMLGGLAIILGSVTPLVVVVLFLLAIDRLVIPHEQRMLEARFGQAYRDYRQRVRRWV
jgi:protein-S-isoprenylcysteine O-methyltransferase Ste14